MRLQDSSNVAACKTTKKDIPAAVQQIMSAFLAIYLFAPFVLAAQGGEATGAVKGTIFVLDSDGPSYVAGAKVIASGPVAVETESNEDGKYAFVEVPAGRYTVEASFSDLKAVQAITVEANQVVEVPLQLKLPEVQTSLTVTAGAEDAKLVASADAVTAKTIRDAPNVNERFEGVLPLIPGVVRGPDGLMNLKGARNTQSGALVNSANVTDPATGSPAISLPIDVVSSVQVISNPYDPEYGKLTGAVSSVETKTGNYEGFHFSIQNVLPRPRERGGSIVGIGATTPPMTFTGPLIKDRIAFTQSFEYRYVRTPGNSLPPLQRDTNLESFNSYPTTIMIHSSNKLLCAILNCGSQVAFRPYAPPLTAFRWSAFSASTKKPWTGTRTATAWLQRQA